VSQHSAFLDRMSEKLADLGRSVDDLKRRDPNDRRVADLHASIDVQRDRLNEMRRAGAELTPEMVESFSRAVDGLRTRIGRELQQAA
jgi:hypothetical protein